jgi:hypothetical protein
LASVEGFVGADFEGGGAVLLGLGGRGRGFLILSDRDEGAG